VGSVRACVAWVSAGLLVAAVLAGCDDQTPLDSVADLTTDGAVWRADAQKIAATLPQRLATFAPSEGVAPFYTSYATGPVFGASCTYADGDHRQVTVRVETGNIRSRASAALDARALAADTKFVTHEARVHGLPAVQRWSSGGRVGQVAFLVARRYLVEVRLVPAASEAEAMSLAEGIDLGPLEALVLDGVKAK